jgi:hypothetical protein
MAEGKELGFVAMGETQDIAIVEKADDEAQPRFNHLRLRTFEVPSHIACKHGNVNVNSNSF